MPGIVPTTLALFGTIGWTELIILAVIGVLLFGKRLPEVGRSLGKGIVEFKKGLQGIEDEVDQAGKADADKRTRNQLPPADSHASLRPDAGGDRAQAPRNRDADA